MRRGILLLTLAGSILLACTGAVLAQQAGSAPSRSASSEDVAPGEILVKFKKGTSKAKKQEAYEKKGDKLKKTIPKIKVDVVKVPSGKEQSKVAEYESDPTVEFAEVNGIYRGIVEEPTADGPKVMYTPNDPQYGQQYQYAKIQANQAWDVTQGSNTAKIAILDTGIDQSHEDLSNKIGSQKNFTTENSIDDQFGHGTHVAGSASAGSNNSIGVAGTCLGCTLYNGKVLNDNNQGQWDWIAAGIIWAVDPNNDGNTSDGAKVINLSLGGIFNSQAVEAAVNEAWSKGVVVVAAAGNANTSTRFYPAALENVIAVASTDSNDNRSSFSNYGADWVDVAAPGSSILSTAPDHTNVIWGTGVKYGTIDGTSMAAPHVAGLAGLTWSKNGLCTTNTCVRDQIENNTDKISGTGTYWAKGRINANKSVTSGTTPSDTTPPDTTIDASPPDTVSSTAATFEFSSNEANSTFECRLDGTSDSDWEPCTSPKTYTNLASGSHTFEVRATDAADNTDDTPASRTWSIEPDATEPPTDPPTDPPTSGEKVTICHKGNVTITVSSHAWAAHDRHGDVMGSCSATSSKKKEKASRGGDSASSK